MFKYAVAHEDQLASLPSDVMVGEFLQHLDDEKVFGVKDDGTSKRPQIILGNIEKGFDIMKGQSVGDALTSSKTRSFYMNFAYLNQTDDVTADSHMGKVFMPFGVSQDEMTALMEQKKSDDKGHAGVGYVAIAEASRRAGAKLGLRGSEAQAAYWVHVRKNVKWPRGKAA